MVIETARKHPDKIGKVYAGRNSIIGALTENLIDTTQESVATRKTPRIKSRKDAMGGWTSLRSVQPTRAPARSQI